MRHLFASIAAVEDEMRFDWVVNVHDTDLERGVW